MNNPIYLLINNIFTNMKKKTYEKPQFEAFEVEAADIIATSTQTDAFGNPAGLGYTEDTW